MAEEWRKHTLLTIEQEGDLFVASCLFGDWRSEGFDTKKEARDAHAEHVLTERLRK